MMEGGMNTAPQKGGALKNLLPVTRIQALKVSAWAS